MAYDRLQYRKLVYAVGSKTATPVTLSGVVPYPEGITIPVDSTGWTRQVSGSYASTEGAAVLAARDSMPGCEIHDILESMTNGQYMYIYNPDAGNNFCFCIYKDDSTTYKYCVDIYGTKSPLTNYGQWSVHQNEYYGTPKWWTGFFYNSDDGRIVPMSALGFGTNDSSQVTHRVIAESIAADARVQACLSVIFAGNVIEPPSNDPYSEIGLPAEDQLQSGPARGSGDDTSDVISIPSTPTLNLAACQMINVYVPSLTDVQALARYLWTNFDLHDPTNTLSKVFTDPINAILSLHILPFTPESSSAIPVTFGGYATSVQIPPASEQFHDVDCGSISFSEFWGNYLDYNPYTRITACLPFVGQVDLDPDEVMGKTVKIKYRVDIVTGAFVCFLYIDGEKVLGQYAGNMAQQVPVSAADFSRLNAAILNVASTAAAGFGGAVMGGFSAASAAEGGISAGLGLGQSAVDNVLNAKVRVAHSGGLSGSPGIMGILKPYVIIHRARQSVPTDANKFKGYPCNAKFTLSDLEGCGFTSVRRIKLDGIKLTEGELEELRQILAAGVYL